MASTRTKLIIAFGLFVLSLCLVIVGVVVHSGEEAPQKIAAQPTKANTVFYKSIGRATDVQLKPQGAPPKVSATYTLEIKVAKSRKEAEGIIDMLRGLGVKAYYTPLNRSGRVVYRIRHGLFKSPRIAEKASMNLQSSKQVANRVIQL